MNYLTYLYHTRTEDSGCACDCCDGVPVMDRNIKGMKREMSDSWPFRIRKARTLIEWLPKGREDAIIRENVALIKTIPPDMHKRIAAYIKSVFRGRRTRDELVRYLIRIGDVTEARAEMIADDQITKVAELFLVEKWKKQGVKWVKWVHKGATEPRKYHLAKWDGKSGRKDGKPNGLNGFIFRLDKPPVINPKTDERGYPGQMINCHCHMEKVKVAGLARSKAKRKKS